jgi:hypothetical protein
MSNVSRIKYRAERKTEMTITLTADLEAVLVDQSQRFGLSPETIAIKILREKLVSPVPPIEPRDDWERGLLEIGSIGCGASPPHEALSSEGLYD